MWSSVWAEFKIREANLKKTNKQKQQHKKQQNEMIKKKTPTKQQQQQQQEEEVEKKGAVSRAKCKHRSGKPRNLSRKGYIDCLENENIRIKKEWKERD